MNISIPDGFWGHGYDAAQLWGDTSGDYSGCYAACEVFRLDGDGWTKVGDAASAQSWTFDVTGPTAWEVRFKIKAWEGHNMKASDLPPGAIAGEPPGKSPSGFSWKVVADCWPLPQGAAESDTKSGTYSGGTDNFHVGHSTAGGMAVPVAFSVDVAGAGHVSVG